MPFEYAKQKIVLGITNYKCNVKDNSQINEEIHIKNNVQGYLNLYTNIFFIKRVFSLPKNEDQMKLPPK